MKEHIYIYGEIEDAQISNAGDYGVVSLKSVVDQIKNTEANELIVHIHSRGGSVDEGFAIHDVLVNSGKKVTTIIEGLCASIATVIALAGKDRLMSANSTFMIHNPWTMGMGNADDMTEIAEQLREIEDKILNFYVDKTGADIEELRAMMKEETYMSVSKAKELGFVTEELQVKAYARITNLKNNNMSEIKNSIEKLTDMVKGVLSSLNIKAEEVENVEVKNKNYTTTDGKSVKVITEAEEIAIGDVVEVDGASAPDMTLTLEDGTVIKTDSESKISEIESPSESQQADENMKAENEALKVENEAIKKELEEAKNAINDLKAKVEFIAKNVKTTHSPEEISSFRKPVSSVEEDSEIIKALRKKK